MQRQGKIKPLSIVAMLSFLLAIAALAQESRWKALDTRIVKLQGQGKNKEALPVAEEALHIAEATFGAENPNTAIALSRLGLTYDGLGEYDKAEPLYQHSLSSLPQWLRGAVSMKRTLKCCLAPVKKIFVLLPAWNRLDWRRVSDFLKRLPFHLQIRPRVNLGCFDIYMAGWLLPSWQRKKFPAVKKPKGLNAFTIRAGSARTSHRICSDLRV